MLQTLSLYFQLLSIQVRSQMQYRVSFLMDIVSTGLTNATYFFSLFLILDRFKQISGWNLGDIAWLAGMTEISFAVMDMVFSGFDPDYFVPLIRMGLFDQYLLRPVNITLQVLGSRFIVRRLGRILEGLTIFMIGLLLSQIHWTLIKLIYLPIVFFSQVICFGSLFIMGSTLTFWTTQKIEAINILTYGGNEMITYPMNIYPQWLRHFFTFIIPLIFMNYYPALYFLNKPDPLNFPSFTPFLTPFTALLMLFIALQFWRIGITHYKSTGS
jgi:ABC-2 type transport system permease protein